MNKIKILIFFLIILGGIFFFRDSLLDFYSKLSLKLPQIEEGITNFLKQQVEKQVLTPPPLRAPKEDPQSFLTRAGVIEWTNIQREKYGLPPLKENLKLDSSAELKIKDMFKNQYFSHDSPSGEGVGDLVAEVGYEFIAIGENLALGNFKNDEVLVQEWMQSIGHRENILNTKYQEIGVAVAKGIFEGESTWLAVQHFGLPLSACPQPEETVETKIKENQTQIEELQETLKLLEIEIRTAKPKRGAIFNQKVEQYNALVSQYNILIQETEILINQYNNQVRLFNECATSE